MSEKDHVVRLFLSYRRSDAEASASALCRDLVAKFGEAAVFFDRDGIDGGATWPDRLRHRDDDEVHRQLIGGPLHWQ